MSQHNYDVSNQAGAAFRADLNLALAAIRNVNSGATEPASMVAYMLWMDTTTGTLKQRNAANTAWVVGGITSFASIATAAGTTTLVFDSAEDIEFTGSATQTIVMPVTTTLPAGWKRNIINNSTDALTINSSGANLVQTLSTGERTTITCILASGTTAASWAVTVQLKTSNSGILTIAGQLNLSGNIVSSARIYTDEAFAARGGTATPAGGNYGFIVGSDQVGICWGSGAPTMTAARGSLYLRTDNGANTSLYVNRDGGTTWAAVTSA